MRSRVLISTAAMALVAGTMYVAAEVAAPPAGAPPGAQGEPKGEPKGDPKGTPQPKAEPKSKAEPKAVEPKTKTEPKAKADPKGTEAPPPGKQPKAAEPKPKNGAPPATGEKAAPKDDKGAGKSSTTVTTEQRTEIRQTIIKSGNAPRVANVNFNVSIGTTVPRTVTVVVLPPRVVEIYPAWRGYRYFIVGERIIIIDDGYRIIFIIDA